MKPFLKDALLGLLAHTSNEERKAGNMEAYYALNRAWLAIHAIVPNVEPQPLSNVEQHIEVYSRARKVAEARARKTAEAVTRKRKSAR